MGASVFWKPVKSNEHSFDVSAPSSFATTMSKRFGSEPWEVGPDDIDWLTGVLDAGDGSAKWDDIIRAIEEHGAIRIWREF